jgi:small conductance mechanosensitive channel
MTWESFGQWWLDMFQSIGNWFVNPDANGINNITRIIIAIVVTALGILLIRFICWILKKTLRITNKLAVDISVKSFTVTVVRFILYIVLAFIVLAILNVSVTGFAGIASAITVALGLSLQDLISSFFSGIVLLRAQYFHTGDYIHIKHNDGQCEGKVKRINIFVTELTTFDNQIVTINNNKLLASVITNFSRNHTRRLVLSIDIDYSSDVELVKSVLNKIVTEETRILETPKPQIHVDALGEYSINMKVKCYTLIDNYWDVRNSIYETILLEFRSNNIKIPFRRFVIESYEGEKEKED